MILNFFFKNITKKILLKNCNIVRKISLNLVTNNKCKHLAMDSKNISICHMKSTNDKIHNLNQVKQIIKLSKEQNACFVFLPECCDYVGENRTETLKLSEPLTGNIINNYRDLAKNNNMWISAGGIHESIPDENGITKNIYNSHVIINNSGEIVAVYRKLHLFDVETPEFRFRESEVVKAGPCLVAPIDSPIGKIGLQICYDMRFSEASTILRYDGAQILTYPSAFAYSTGIAHWEILLRARAIENQCYVIASAQIGFHNKKRQSYGHAMVVDPWGKILNECKQNELTVCSVEIDLNQIEKIKKNMPCFEHRRKDVYTLRPLQLKVEFDHNNTNFMFEKYPIPTDTIFYCTDNCVAFTNIRCVVPGHVLVATRRSVPRLKDLETDEITDLFQAVCKVQKMLENYYKTTSSTVTVQDGENAGQTVKHVHCHIMPRRLGDFCHNDEIYTELNKHDADDNVVPRRSFREMATEAAIYRDLLSCKS